MQDAPARPRIARQETRKTKTHYNKVSYQRPATNPATTARKKQFDPIYLPQIVSYSGKEKARHHRHRYGQPFSLSGTGPTARHAATVSASASRGFS
ncbi:hypothetical protein VXQ18_08980 [Brucella abortus]|nr:hypothetical protein [Brucella abortus]